ncbi:MAG: hydantoinase B/oxoprolinase family protein [Alphaproteobacteria bacterium]
MTTLDPVTLAVLNGRLEQIVDEMDATLFRSAFNPIIAEAHDASHGIYHRSTGETLAQGKSGLPIFVGAMAFAVKTVIDKAEKDNDLEDGDVYIFNDPWDGGTHLSDFRLVQPIFRKGKVFCWIASVGHWHDVGGAVPGNYNPAATEAFQEGFVCPPVKLFRGGLYQQDIQAMLEANSRLPMSLYGDLNAQINALNLGAQRLHAILDEYTDDVIDEAMIALKDRAERLMRREIEGLPDGVYQATDYMDNDGVVDEELKLSLKITIAGDEMELDFSGSAGSCLGPINISKATTHAACYVAMKHVFDEIPANAGAMVPVNVVIPEDSILAATAPKPVGGYTETILRLIDLVFQAMSEAAPQRTNGCAYGTINALSIAGRRSDSGAPWVMFSFFGGGHGGSANEDGLQHGNAPISTATIPPLEILEAAYPVVFRQWALRPDSGGPGKYRGGLGAIYEIELLEENAQAFLFGERARTSPPGVLGGKPAALNKFFYDTEGAEQPISPPMASKIVGIPMKRGMRLRLETPGGGGYGCPNDRSRQSILADLEAGYISESAAARDYGDLA